VSLTEPERHPIIQWFQEQMGPERGELMMKAIAPVGWHDIATNRDLLELEGRMRAEMQVLRAELRAEMAELRAELHSSLRAQAHAFLAGNAVLLGLFTGLNQLLG
jgi:hypothetical protein